LGFHTQLHPRKFGDAIFSGKEVDIIQKYISKISKIFDIYNKISKLDVSVSQLYPITVFENGMFLVYDLDNLQRNYFLAAEQVSEIHVPEGVRACFPLDFYGGKISAVVSPDAFNDIYGYIAIFHEFVHCYQFENYEMELKDGLEIAHRAQEKKDFMWELTHSFPYNDKKFIDETEKLARYFEIGFIDGIKEYYLKMKRYLKKCDYEYMIWQQWKEGFARYIENKIRSVLKVPKNTNKIVQPFKRVTFYEIGSKYIDVIFDTKPEVKGNLKKLFRIMFECSI